MPWTRPTLEEIKTRMESDATSRLTGGTPLLRFSMLKVLITAVAGMIHILHGFLSFLAKQLLPTTAEDQWLDDQATSWGLARNAAGFANGTVNFTGTNGNPIPAGTVYLSALGIEYVTQGSATIVLGIASATVISRTAGEIGNLPTGTLLTAQAPVPGVNDSATSGVIAGGTEKETNESLRERILSRISNPPAGGSEEDYKAWARSVTGVGKAWVFGNYFGLGTVAVVIRSTGSDPVPVSGVLTAVAAYIDTLRPVTVTVTVAPVVSATVAMSISISPNTTDVKGLISANIADLFTSEMEPNGVLYLSHIQRAITLAGVLDYRITALSVGGVSQPVANYNFADFKYGILGTITYGSL